MAPRKRKATAVSVASAAAAAAAAAASAPADADEAPRSKKRTKRAATTAAATKPRGKAEGKRARAVAAAAAAAAEADEAEAKADDTVVAAAAAAADTPDDNNNDHDATNANADADADADADTDAAPLKGYGNSVWRSSAVAPAVAAARTAALRASAFGEWVPRDTVLPVVEAYAGFGARTLAVSVSADACVRVFDPFAALFPADRKCTAAAAADEGLQARARKPRDVGRAYDLRPLCAALSEREGLPFDASPRAVALLPEHNQIAVSVELNKYVYEVFVFGLSQADGGNGHGHGHGHGAAVTRVCTFGQSDVLPQQLVWVPGVDVLVHVTNTACDVWPLRDDGRPCTTKYALSGDAAYDPDSSNSSSSGVERSATHPVVDVEAVCAVASGGSTTGRRRAGVARVATLDSSTHRGDDSVVSVSLWELERVDRHAATDDAAAAGDAGAGVSSKGAKAKARGKRSGKSKGKAADAPAPFRGRVVARLAVPPGYVPCSGPGATAMAYEPRTRLLGVLIAAQGATADGDDRADAATAAAAAAAAAAAVSASAEPKAPKQRLALWRLPAEADAEADAKTEIEAGANAADGTAAPPTIAVVAAPALPDSCPVGWYPELHAAALAPACRGRTAPTTTGAAAAAAVSVTPDTAAPTATAIFALTCRDGIAVWEVDADTSTTTAGGATATATTRFSLLRSQHPPTEDTPDGAPGAEHPTGVVVTQSGLVLSVLERREPRKPDAAAAAAACDDDGDDSGANGDGDDMFGPPPEYRLVCHDLRDGSALPSGSGSANSGSAGSGELTRWHAATALHGVTHLRVGDFQF